MSYQLKKVDPKEVYYHALYHHVAHWAAYVGMMVALTTIAAVLSSTQMPVAGIQAWGVACTIVLTTAGAVYFIRGMDTYGAVLRDALPEPYLRRTQTFRHKVTIMVGGGAAIAAGLGNLGLLWMLTR